MVVSVAPVFSKTPGFVFLLVWVTLAIYLSVNWIGNKICRRLYLSQREAICANWCLLWTMGSPKTPRLSGFWIHRRNSGASITDMCNSVRSPPLITAVSMQQAALKARQFGTRPALEYLKRHGRHSRNQRITQTGLSDTVILSTPAISTVRNSHTGHLNLLRLIRLPKIWGSAGG